MAFVQRNIRIHQDDTKGITGSNALSVLTEGALKGKVLSEGTKGKIERAFGDCVEKLAGQKITYPDKRNVWGRNNKKREKKVGELVGILEGLVREAGAENELSIKKEMGGLCAYPDSPTVYIEVQSKTSGFYARFTINLYIGKAFLFVNPGAMDSEPVDIGLEGATNGNSKQLMLKLAEMLANFKNPEVWKNPGAWTEKLSHHFDLDVCEGGDKAFAQRMSHIESAVRNFISGLEDAGTFKVYGNSSVFPGTERSVSVKHNGETIADLTVSYHDGEPFGQLTLSTTKKKTEWRLDNDSNVRILVAWLFKEISDVSQIKQ